MQSSGFELLLKLIEVVIKFQFPVVLFMMCIIFFLKIHRFSSGLGSADKLLLTIAGFNLLLWVFVYGEHYSDGSILLFDYGAPLFGFSSLMVLPVMTVSHVILTRKNNLSILRSDIVVTYLFTFLSLIPGLFLASYILTAILSGK